MAYETAPPETPTPEGSFGYCAVCYHPLDTCSHCGTVAPTADFGSDLEALINRYSKENGSNTPDFILAQFLQFVLIAAEGLINRREVWYGRTNDGPGGGKGPVPMDSPVTEG